MKVSIGNCFIVLVVAQILTQVYLSHSSFSSSGCPLPLPISFSTPTFPMPRERGNPKRGPTYYNFVARHHRPGPSIEPVPPPIAQDHPVGPPLNFSPSSTQNWMEDDQPMAYVEEEIPQDPPLEPTDSFLFSASDILTPPLTSGHLPLEGDFATDLGGFPIKEEFPTEVQ
jgi:hypothetical protein